MTPLSLLAGRTVVVLLLLHFDVMWLLVICIFLMVPWADVQCVIVAFLGLTRLLFHIWTSLSKKYSELKKQSQDMI